MGIVQAVRPDELRNETCDYRCDAEGRVLVGRGSLRLVTCSHHFTENELALTAGGWTVRADSRPALTVR